MQDETKWTCKICNVLGSSLTGARYVSVFLQDVRPLSKTVYDIAGQVFVLLHNRRTAYSHGTLCNEFMHGITDRSKITSAGVRFLLHVLPEHKTQLLGNASAKENHILPP